VSTRNYNISQKGEIMLKRLKSWLKKPENSYSKLASLLGYKSKSTIYNWLVRGYIPRKNYSKLKEVFDVSKSRKKKSKA
jgi:hypothetical protein